MLSQIRSAISDLLERWGRHRHGNNAAALAFYTLISLLPMLLVGVLTAGIFLGPRVAEGEMQAQIDHLMGEDAATFINRLLEQSRATADNAGIGYLLSFAILLFTGSLAIAHLRHTLNRIFLAAPTASSPSFLSGLAARGIAALVILACGLLLITSTLLNAFISTYAEQIEFGVLKHLQLANNLQLISNFLLLIALFTMLLKALPRHRPSLKAAVIGASVGAALTASLKWAMELQLRHGNLDTLYGSTVSIFVFLFWIYFSMHAFIFGAEIASQIEINRRKKAEALDPGPKEPTPEKEPEKEPDEQADPPEG